MTLLAKMTMPDLHQSDQECGRYRFFLNKEVFISLSFSIVFFYKREKSQIIRKQFKTILLIYIMYTWSDKPFNATVVNRALVQRVTWNYTYSPFNFKIGKKLCRPSWVTSLVRQFKLKKVVQQSISTNNIHYRNWVFATNSDFLIQISLQSNNVDLNYFKLWILLEQII